MNLHCKITADDLSRVTTRVPDFWLCFCSSLCWNWPFVQFYNNASPLNPAAILFPSVWDEIPQNRSIHCILIVVGFVSTANERTGSVAIARCPWHLRFVHYNTREKNAKNISVWDLRRNTPFIERDVNASPTFIMLWLRSRTRHIIFLTQSTIESKYISRKGYF